jgi:uncharacterized Zn finger protein (UPF0148 family)
MPPDEQPHEHEGEKRMTVETVDPLNLPTSFTISQARAADLGEHPRLLDGLLYVGLTVLFSPPGLGKSMLSAAVEEHLAYGRPFGPWAPERPYRCMVVDLEGDMRLAAERSLTNTPWGLLPSDHGRPVPADIEYETEWAGTEFVERLARLEARLQAAADQGQPYAYVRIDTMRLFIGSKPHGVNAYDFDAFCLRALNRVALRYRVAMVVVHHTNKAGEVSGSTGVAGSALVVIHLKRNPDNDDECVLQSEKVRVDAPFRYALMMDDRGRWEFTDAISPTQAQLTGTKRAIVDVLTSRGPRVLADLRDALPLYNNNTIKAALRRLSHEGIAAYRHGRWELAQDVIADHPACSVCGMPMDVYERGQTRHPGCHTVPEQQTAWAGEEPAPAAEQLHDDDQEHEEEHDQEDDDHPESRRFNGYAEMIHSFEKSRMKPMLRIVKEEREGAPWRLITEQMDGAHQTKSWTGPMPEEGLLAVLDRNGSFPSACSSVPVAANKLTHSGELGADVAARKSLAGIFQVTVPEWPELDRTPHPLGRLARVGERVWVSSPHMEHLDKLAAAGRLPLLEVHDSWTGRRGTSLFERFYAWAKMLREQTAGADEATRVEAKQAISKAIRALYPKQMRSPFWRPDWNIAIRAEASVRHWITADRAVQGGAVLIGLGFTDEAVFAVPADVADPTGWVPDPYRIGPGFGQVKHKSITIRTGEELLSPVSVEQYAQRGVRRRDQRQR